MKRTRLGSAALILGMSLSALPAPLAQAFAAETFDYPELTVTPRASERLEMEAKQEGEHRYSTYLPIQVSALTTLVAGFVQGGNVDPSKDPDKHSPIAGYVIGGGWLALTGVMMFTEEPYAAAAREVRPMPKGSVREQLTRERMAEEAIQRRARLGRTLKWLSFASNAFAGGYMLANGNDTAKAFDAIALVGSLAPIVFPFHWEEVANEQSEYKKRIYAPVAQATFLRAPDGAVAPGMTLSLRF